MTQQKIEEERVPFPRFPLQETLAELDIAGTYVRANRPRDHIWASSLGACRKSVWTEWNHPRPHDDDFEQHRGALGHAVEDNMAAKLKRVIVAREVSFTTPLISGRADFVVRLERGGPMIPVECKSTTAFDWSMKDPKRAHVLQTQFYVSQTDAPFGILLYYNLANWGGQMGHWGTLYVPRDDAGLQSRAELLWADVHGTDAPACENPGEKNGCWDCNRAEGTLDEGGH